MDLATAASLEKSVKRPEVNEQVRQIIVMLRGHRVILDADLAALYGVENRVFR